ncbi:steroid hormone receptor ERR2-like [Asterias rubens]|uniref:steroid hormone receptor ERR2-like n=1 Tax=Asterias rubens TaxID=7604 RepID=UPI0014557685|nr:steroid hormone receptor ERR2-like [Asterias rubens]
MEERNMDDNVSCASCENTEVLSTENNDGLPTDNTEVLSTENTDVMSTENTNGPLSTDNSDELSTEDTNVPSTENTNGLLSTDNTDGLSTENTDGLSTADSKRRCVVCCGLATGYHYGVASCEACKAFFKRTIQKNISYSCTENRQCKICPGKRRKCQACRYDRCIQAGMMVDGVRVNRAKGGRQKYRRRPDENDFSPATTGKKRRHILALEFSERLLEIEPEVLKITIPEEVIQKRKLAGGKILPQDLAPAMKLMAEMADRALITTVRWAKQVPGFDKLCLNNQMALLCNSWMEVLLTNVIYRTSVFIDGNDIVYFAKGLLVYREDLYSSPDWSTSTTLLIFDQIMNVVNRFRLLKLSKGIVVILKTMMLFNAGPSLSNRLPLQSMQEIQDIQSTVQDALHYRIQQDHPGDSRLVYHLMMLMPLIKDVALTVASQVWSEFIREQIPLQQLLKEVLQPIMQVQSGQQASTGTPRCSQSFQTADL